MLSESIMVLERGPVCPSATFESAEQFAAALGRERRPPMPDDLDRRINWRGWVPRGSELFARSPLCELRPRFAVGLGVHDISQIGGTHEPTPERADVTRAVADAEALLEARQ